MDIAYFGYGANLNQASMSIKCPNANYFATGRLDGYKFITNEIV